MSNLVKKVIMSEFAENPSADDQAVPDEVAAMFDLTQKKKKKKSKKVEVSEEQTHDGDENATESAATGSAPPDCAGRCHPARLAAQCRLS